MSSILLMFLNLSCVVNKANQKLADSSTWK